MLTPEYLQQITDGAEELASTLHSNIMDRVIERIMARLGRGKDYIFTQTDMWQISVMQDAGILLSDIQKEISDITKLELKEIKEAMEDAGIKTLEYDSKIYKAAGLSPLPLEQSPAIIRLLERNYNAIAYDQAVTEAIRNVSDNGIKVKYPTGREMTIEAATMMIVRTGIGQASAEVSLARAKEMGVEYVLTSAHLGARPTHEPWQGKVFSIDWNKIKV